MSHTPTRSNISAACVVAAISLVSLLGCSSDKVTNPPPGGGSGTTSYSGTIAGGGVSGSLDITISTSTPAPQQAGYRAVATVTATGTLILTTGGSGTVALTGTYDDASDILTLAGGGWDLAGGLTTFGMEGFFQGPGSPRPSGVFSVQTQGSGADTVRVYLGTFTNVAGGGDNGVFNIALRGSVAHGNAVSDGGTVVPLDGTYTVADSSLIIVHPSGGAPLATGTVHTYGRAEGTYDDQAGNTGTWTGTKQP